MYISLFFACTITKVVFFFKNVFFNWGMPLEPDQRCPDHRDRREAKVAEAVDSSRETVLSQRCRLSQVSGVLSITQMF